VTNRYTQVGLVRGDVTLNSTVLVAAALTLALLSSVCWAQSATGPGRWVGCQGCGGGIGHGDSYADWRLGSVAAKLHSASIRRGLLRPEIRVSDSEPAAPENFGERKFSCKLVVRSDGSIAALKILKSSGTEEIDQRALDFIRAAAPFHRAWGNLTEDQTYSVEFPHLQVSLLHCGS
jgi:TonB family protein